MGLSITVVTSRVMILSLVGSRLIGWSPVAHRYWARRPATGARRWHGLVSAAGVTGRPSSAAACGCRGRSRAKASGSPRARIAIVSMVQGPKPGSAASRARDLLPVAADTEVDVAAGQRGDQGGERGAPAPLGRASVSGSSDGQRGGVREQVGEAAGRVVDRFAVRGHQSGGVGAGGRGGDLLAEHGAYRELRRVDGARHPAARCLVDQRRRVSGRCAAGRRRRPGRRRGRAGGGSRVIADGQVAQVGQGQLAVDVVRAAVAGSRHAMAVRQAQGAAVGAVTPLLHARHRRSPRGARTGCPGTAARGTAAAAPAIPTCPAGAGARHARADRSAPRRRSRAQCR